MSASCPPLVSRASSLSLHCRRLRLVPAAALAQAWVPDKGEGSVSVAAQEMNVKKHLATTTVTDAGHINTVVLLADVTYGLTNKIAVDLALPFVSSEYSRNEAAQGNEYRQRANPQLGHRPPFLGALQHQPQGRGVHAVHRLDRPEP